MANVSRGTKLATVALAAIVVTAPWAAPAGASAGYSSLILSLRPAAYWQLGELSGTTASDSSPHHRNGVYQGGPMLGQPGPITDDPTTSAEFNGMTQDVVWRPHSSYRGNFTVIAWIKNLGSTGNAEQTFFDTRTQTAEWSFDFKLSHGRLKVDVGDGSRWFLTGPGIRFTFTTGAWYQVAAVVRATCAELYVDGTRIGAERYPLGTGTPLLYDRSHQVYLATNPRYTTEGFFGLIGQVAIFLRPLRDATISDIYQAGISP